MAALRERGDEVLEIVGEPAGPEFNAVFSSLSRAEQAVYVNIERLTVACSPAAVRERSSGRSPSASRS